MTYQLMQHQKDIVYHASTQNLAIFADCGTGKTAIGLNIIEAWRRLGVGPALVVCPLSIIEAAWIEDAAKFTPHLRIVSLWDRRPAIRDRRLADTCDVYVCNYETFKSLLPKIDQKRFGVIVVDESSKMKCVNTSITQTLLSVAGVPHRKKSRNEYRAQYVIPHRYVMSGTPAPNDESEYWAQIKFCTGFNDLAFNRNYYAFRTKYFSKIDLRNGGTIFSFRRAMKQEFMNALEPWQHTVRSEDVQDLPEQIHAVRKVRLSDKEQKAYDSMEEEFCVQFEHETVLTSNALTKVLSLRELTSGFLYGQDHTVHQTGKSKLLELLDVLAEIGNHQCIIWFNFHPERDAIVKATGGVCPGEPGPERDRIIADFKGGKFRYLVANPASLGHGLTLTNCRYNVYFSLPSSAEYMYQSIKRTHRKSQTESVCYYYLLGDGTYDELIYKSVHGKLDLREATMGWLAERRGK